MFVLSYSFKRIQLLKKRTISKTASDTSLSFIHQSVWPAAAAGAAQRNCHTQKSAKRETKMDDGD